MHKPNGPKRTALAALAIAVLATSATVSASNEPTPTAGLSKALTIAMRQQPDSDRTKLLLQLDEVRSALEGARRVGAALAGLQLHWVWAA